MFLAVTPPSDVINAISDLPTRALRGVKYTRRNQWHIQIRYLGDVERHHALGALSEMQGKATDVALGPQVELLANRIVMLRAEGLDALAETVAASFSDVGEPTERDFFGHLTLARLKGRPLRDPSLVSVLGAPISVQFPVDTIDLWKTEAGQGGTVNTLVATQELT